MARDEDGRNLPDVYAGLTDRRAVKRSLLEMTEEERRTQRKQQNEAYKRLHPRQKFWRELAVWVFAVVFAYAFRNSDMAENHRWGALLLFAFLGWGFPAFRAWQWYQHSRS